MNTTKGNNTSYQDAGVDIDKGNQLVERIKSAASSTHTAGVMGSLGGFSALFDLKKLEYKDPILVSGTDGVGTKIKLAIAMNKHDTIGIDLVAMCVNDLLVQGAQPLFFLDYFACASLDINIASTVIEGITQGCQLANCALVGGETAEMPGMYQPGEYDLAGFCVGAVEREKLIDGSHVDKGNILIGVASSGPHSNGFSLVRKIIEINNIKYNQPFEGKMLGDILLEPTKIYVSSIQKLIEQFSIKGLAHITGGGLLENIPRFLPNNLQAVINTNSWQMPSIFSWLQQQGNIDTYDMYRTFNCGVGMVICIAENDKTAVLDCLTKSGETAWELGAIRIKPKGAAAIELCDD